MSLDNIVQSTADDIIRVLGGDDDQKTEVAQILEKALLKVVSDTRAGCVEAVNICCSSDQDLAHKIAAEMKQKEELLVSNLMSLR